jgi:hypothetical protein
VDKKKRKQTKSYQLSDDSDNDQVEDFEDEVQTAILTVKRTKLIPENDPSVLPSAQVSASDTDDFIQF